MLSFLPPLSKYRCKGYFFNPERKQDTPCMKQLRVLIDGCTEHEAKALIPVIQAVCSVFRDRDTLEMKLKRACFPTFLG